MSMLIEETAFSGNAYRCQNIIARHHDCAYIGVIQLLQHWSCARFELVLEDNEAHKA